FLYTDGLSEARNAQGEEYGVRRISAVLERVRGLAAEAAAGACLDDLAAYRNGTPRSDDLTIMALRRAILK
ncbi:MAG: SpoIIE family protein phosphatase, partial [Thermoanaerobaculia bacterium]